MLGRLIGKFILTCGIALAIALIVTAISARRGDLVISASRSPTYHELRFNPRQITLTRLFGWNLDEPPRCGRTGERLMDPVPFVGKMAGPLPPSDIMLLDHIQVTLIPNKSGWWVLKRASGNWRIPSQPSTWRGAALARLPSTLPGMSFSVPNTAPLSLRSSSTSAPGDDVLATIRGSSQLSIAPKPKPPTAPGPLIYANGTLSISTARFLPTVTYESYALPYWTAIMIALLPVWIALLLRVVAIRRRRSRRRRGLCVACGYDLRGNPQGACPECGHGGPAPVTAPVPA